MLLSLYLEKKKPHYPISNLFLIVLLYIVEAKKGCKKKRLNILSLAAYLLKVVRGLATKRYEFSKYHISKQNKHVCVEQHLYILDMLEFI